MLTFDSRLENVKDLVLYRFGSTGVVQVLSRAAEVLGLVPIFPVRNIHTFASGTGTANGVFKDCVLVKKLDPLPIHMEFQVAHPNVISGIALWATWLGK